jgi:hypothetical protein
MGHRQAFWDTAAYGTTTCNPSTQEAEAGGLQIDASLDYMARFILKKKMGHRKTLVCH